MSAASRILAAIIAGRPVTAPMVIDTLDCLDELAAFEAGLKQLGARVLDAEERAHLARRKVDLARKATGITGR